MLHIDTKKNKKVIMFFKFRSASFSALVALFLLVLSGCAHHPSQPQDTQASLDPDSVPASADSPPDPQHAKLVFRSDGNGIPVAFKLSSSTKDCEGYERVGSVFHSGREVLTPWVARMTEGFAKIQGIATERQKIVPADVSVQIWSQSPTFNRPLVLRFTPVGSRTYLVLDLLLNDRGKHVQQIFDITNAEQQEAVEVQHLPACTTIFF
ncbi:MAG TPA: hypothetical protein VNX00_08255 [Herbaspirillum sp.]|nr:hypothetical protein [Herbaspirillum sp.]